MAATFPSPPATGTLHPMFRRPRDPMADHLEALDLDPTAADQLARRGTPVRVPAGRVLCAEGERGRQAFLLVDGEAHVLLPDAVVTIGAGDVVGELATLDHRRTRNATVVAHTDLEALVFDVRTFNDLAGDPALRPRLVPERPAA